MKSDVLGNSVLEILTRHFEQRADRPFGDVESVSGRTLQRFSFASQEAAENLLDKADRALDDGDLHRARAFVDRAVQLPFDRHEQVAPVAVAAHMKLFCLITDTLEDCEPDDYRWLAAAIDVLATADESARCEVRDVLAAIDNDYKLSSLEHARLRSAVAAVPDRPHLRDLRLAPAELGDVVMSILTVCRMYRAALEASAS